MFARVLALFTLLTLPFAALAQQNEGRTILVLDMSGSMWGQIDGIAKVTIAQEVISGLLDDIPEQEQLGLALYGHRVRGDCTDIQIAVEPGLDTRAAIRDAVNATRPLGKTPMTDSIIAAAEALRYTEDAATVILISDGVETCNPDPCAAARTLEETGVDFTAHVIGFDVEGDAEAVAQMQCIAAETGGQYLSAENADELADALEQVAVEPAPMPVPQTVQIVGVTALGGPEIAEPIQWSLVVEGTEQSGTGPGYALPLVAGSYTVQGVRLSDEATGEASFAVAMDITDGGQRVEVVFPEPILPQPVTLRGVLGTEDGPLITDPLMWTVIDEAGAVTEGGDQTNPSTIELLPGTYTVTGFWPETEISADPVRISVSDAPDQTVTVIFEEPLPQATLDAPDEAPLGSTVAVAWTGPGASGDYIRVTPSTGYDAGLTNTVRVQDGNPAPLLLPVEAGSYVIQYLITGNEVIAERAIEVTPVEASVMAAPEAVAGETIPVTWTGPDYRSDFIGIGKVGAEGSFRWENYTSTSEGSPLDLLMPTEPGDYIIRYFLSQKTTPIAETRITVVDVLATLDAPAEAVAGETILVTWTGPDYQNDFIGVGLADATGSARWDNYTRTSEGSPLRLLVPPQPGDYLITYFVNQDQSVLAQRPLTVTAATATLSAPAEAEVGSAIIVEWTGPDYQSDFIGIGKAGAEGSARWENYTRTSDGSPLRVRAPTEPGDYVITYFMNQDSTPIAQVPITLTSVSATLEAPAEAVAGSTIEVTWTGPDYPQDFIGIGPADGDGAALWDNYTRTSEGSPLRLLTPTEPGAYVITYFVDQDRTILAQIPITLTAVGASLEAPEEAVAGSTIVVTWTGPDYPQDFIGIGRADAEGGERWENYTRTSDGSPLRLLVPTTPGDYLIRYFVDQDRSIIAERPIRVTPVTASLAVPEEAAAGTEIVVEWEGPDYPRDFISVGVVGGQSNDRWLFYTRTDQGSPLRLQLPAEPGEYVINYIVDQDRTVIASVPITVTDDPIEMSFPAEIAGGRTLMVAWSGPDSQGDNIQILRLRDGQRMSFTYTDRGNPLAVVAPVQPGDYEVVYKFRDREIIARQPLTVTDPGITMTFPAEVAGGETFEVAWTGPDARGDNIEIAEVAENANIHFAYTEGGSPVRLIAPLEPGTYEVRYSFLDREVAARQTITVTAPELGITAPASVVAGSEFTVQWVGPDAENDNIEIGEIGAPRGTDWAYTKDGPDLTLTAPDQPGSYELRYMFRDREVAIRVPIEVTAN